jgi:hypothetical protein
MQVAEAISMQSMLPGRVFLGGSMLQELRVTAQSALAGSATIEPPIDKPSSAV